MPATPATTPSRFPGNPRPRPATQSGPDRAKSPHGKILRRIAPPGTPGGERSVGSVAVRGMPDALLQALRGKGGLLPSAIGFEPAGRRRDVPHGGLRCGGPRVDLDSAASSCDSRCPQRTPVSVDHQARLRARRRSAQEILRRSSHSSTQTSPGLSELEPASPGPATAGRETTHAWRNSWPDHLGARWGPWLSSLCSCFP